MMNLLSAVPPPRLLAKFLPLALLIAVGTAGATGYLQYRLGQAEVSVEQKNATSVSAATGENIRYWGALLSLTSTFGLLVGACSVLAAMGAMRDAKSVAPTIPLSAQATASGQDAADAIRDLEQKIPALFAELRRDLSQDMQQSAAPANLDSVMAAKIDDLVSLSNKTAALALGLPERLRDTVRQAPVRPSGAEPLPLALLDAKISRMHTELASALSPLPPLLEDVAALRLAVEAAAKEAPKNETPAPPFPQTLIIPDVQEMLERLLTLTLKLSVEIGTAKANLSHEIAVRIHEVQERLEAMAPPAPAPSLQEVPSTAQLEKHTKILGDLLDVLNLLDADVQKMKSQARSA